MVNPRRLVFLVTWSSGKLIKVASPSPQKISHIRKPCEAKLFGGNGIISYLCHRIINSEMKINERNKDVRGTGRRYSRLCV